MELCSWSWTINDKISNESDVFSSGVWLHMVSGLCWFHTEDGSGIFKSMIMSDGDTLVETRV